MNQKISLIIPTYNRAPLLKEALESVFKQTLVPDEIIVVDDGSGDNTDKIVAQYPTVQYIFQENCGVSSARNRGIEVSTGTWIMFLDSDDLWLPNKVKTQLEEIEKRPKFLISYTNEIWIRNGRRINQGKRHAKYGGWIFEQCLPLCIISPSSVMIHRYIFEKIGLFDETLPACEDYDLWLRISGHYPIHFIQKSLIEKRGGHPDQLSKKFYGMDRFRIQALQKMLHNPALTPSLKNRVSEEIKIKSAVYAQGCLKRDKLQEYEYYQVLSQ